jgi:hypothetical protein
VLVIAVCGIVLLLFAFACRRRDEEDEEAA